MKRNTAVRPRLRRKVSRPAVANRRGQALDGLLQTAGRLMGEQGVGTVSVEQILLATGMSRGTFYSYFSSKSELVAALVEPALSLGTTRLLDIEAGPASAAVAGLVDVYIDLWKEHRAALMVIPSVDADSFIRIREGHDAFIDALGRVLASAARAGLLRNRDARLSLKVLTRTAIPLLRVYQDHPDGIRLYRESMLALLLPSRSPRAPGSRG
jgi:AcrR family transcriptional regulator